MLQHMELKVLSVVASVVTFLVQFQLHLVQFLPYMLDVLEHQEAIQMVACQLELLQIVVEQVVDHHQFDLHHYW
jgi:hypothetical protein